MPRKQKDSHIAQDKSRVAQQEGLPPAVEDTCGDVDGYAGQDDTGHLQSAQEHDTDHARGSVLTRQISDDRLFVPSAHHGQEDLKLRTVSSPDEEERKYQQCQGGKSPLYFRPERM